MYNFDHKPFPIEIGLLIDFVKNIFFERLCMEASQTDEVFAPLAF